MIEEALFSKLTSDAGLSALIGARLYPAIADPDVAEDYVTYMELGRNPAGPFDSPLEQSRFRFYIYSRHHNESPNYVQCKRMAQALKKAMQHLAGDVGDTCISFSRYDTQSDTWDEPSLKHGVEADYIITFRET